jgi:FkbH-like protein
MKKFFILSNYVNDFSKEIIQDSIKDQGFLVDYVEIFDSVEQGVFDIIDYSSSKNCCVLIHIMPKHSELLIPSHLNLEAYLNSIHQVTERYKAILKLLADNSFSQQIIIPNYSMPDIFEIAGIDSVKLRDFYNSIHNENLQLKVLTSSFKNVKILDTFTFVNSSGTSQIYSYKFHLVARMPYTNLFFELLAESISVILSEDKKKMKCLAVDLDNTIWGGVVGEVGACNLDLGQGYPGECFLNFQKYLLELKEQGVILALISKNNYDDALAGFLDSRMVLKIDDFAAVRINWNPKSQNLIEICDEISIGLDSVVFFDDSSIERQEVKFNLPMVHVFDVPVDPFDYIFELRKANLFENFNFTREDSFRNDTYKENKYRNILKNSFSSKNDFLLSLSMKVEIEKVTLENLPRAMQLINKTNQFNLNPVRIDEITLSERINTTSHFIFNLMDKFGDYGRVGLVGFEEDFSKDTLLIDLFAISCRALNRNLEFFMLSYLLNYFDLNDKPDSHLVWTKTQKNLPAANFLRKLGFQVDQSLNFRLNSGIVDIVGNECKDLFQSEIKFK